MIEDEETQKRRADDELLYVTKDARGRRFLYRLMHDLCGMEGSSFSNDALVQAYAQGMRDVGLALKAQIIALDKQIYLAMEMENL